MILVRMVDSRDETANNGFENRYPTRELQLSTGALQEVIFGSVCAHYVKRNGKTCGPYWFLFFRVAGKLRKKYVPGHLLETVRAHCQAARAEQAEIARINRIGRENSQFLTQVSRWIREHKSDQTTASDGPVFASGRGSTVRDYNGV